ncbi:hypothetical protein J421_1350 [Gemmatirosa kalamazoonensis]|uniref:Uncharacterized protein n=1 Tax=Gemmatirosa kalamazoonensis TaxID=861299 RepID=W0REL4_9BACT|nr:hypothetical protein [Gemmatirosa kalamazoonensis]AHG88887.1 hypothetical protein J421_1350 [Gemmatirosa kalamazoonensis]
MDTVTRRRSTRRRAATSILAVVVAGSAACGGRWRAGEPTNDLRPALAASRRAIAAARSRLDTVLADADRAAAASLLADSVEMRVDGRAGEATVIARGREALLARLAAFAGPGDVVLLPRQTEHCIGAGYETGVYTRYQADPTGARTATSGGYAIAWQVRDGRAAVRALVVRDVREFEHAPRGVACMDAAAVERRASRTGIAIASVYSNWPAAGTLDRAAARAGWGTPAKNGQTAAPPCAEGSAPWSPIADQVRLQLSLHRRFGTLLGAELVSVPTEVTRCYRSLNPRTQTVVSQTVALSDHDAFVNLHAGGARVGAGLAYTRVRTRSMEDSVGASAWKRADVRTTGGTLGVAGQAAYTFGVGTHLYGELGGRVRFAPAMTPDRLLNFVPASIPTWGYALSLAAGVAF